MAAAFTYKGVWPRFFAALVDGLLIGIPTYFVMQKVLMRSFEAGTYSPGGMTTAYIIPTALFLVYAVLLDATGGTLGKRLLGMRIVDKQGNKPGLGRSLVRNLLRVIDAIPFVIPYLLGVLLVAKTSAKQRVGDKAAGTFVVARPR